MYKELERGEGKGKVERCLVGTTEGRRKGVYLKLKVDHARQSCSDGSGR